MRYRDYFWILFPFLVLVCCYYSGILAAFGLSPTSEEVNRDDANRVGTVLLSQRDWVEFHISPAAEGIRLMTNAALKTNEMPRQNQSDPRVGWRYSIEYQLLDADGELIRQTTYESRSRLRQLVDADTGELINPLMFGKTGQIATQTRFIQIPINPDTAKPAIMRVRAVTSDDQISEIVARVRTKHQRPHFDSPSTWRQISLTSRRKLAKYCVFDQKFLTQAERASLLRWYWMQAPTLNKITLRHLYFIGEIDDQEAVEPSASPSNTIIATQRITLPMPERQGNLSLMMQRLEGDKGKPIYASVRFYPSDQSEPISWEKLLDVVNSEMVCPVRGGLVEFETTHDASWSATWTNDDPESPSVEIDGAEIGFGQTVEMRANKGNLRVYLADNIPITYRVSHFKNQPTPFRITCRLAFGDAFASDEVQSAQKKNAGSFEGWSEAKNLKWLWLDEKDNIIEQGTVVIEPEISLYDKLWKAGEPNLVSEFKHYYFSIPPEAAKIQFHSDLMPFLLNASVRPNHLPVLTRLPEDHQPFTRRTKPHRKWFNLRPDQSMELISNNRSFVISTQTRPRESEDDLKIDHKQWQWQRYEPNGQWIGRQLLAPAMPGSEVSDASVGSSFYEMQNQESYLVEDYDFGRQDNYRLIYINPTPQQGELVVKQNGVVVQREKLISSRGSVKLNLQPLENAQGPSSIELTGPTGIRMFFSGANVVGGKRFLKRTASKLENGKLKFEYEKTTHLDEMLTLLIYRQSTGKARCKLSVKIEAEDKIQLLKSGPVESLTSLHQVYDLKSSPQKQSAILIGTDAELDVEHRCFIRLGPDLPLGQYTINVERIDEEDGGFVLLYQSTPISNTPNTP
ncbi:hypothetical protein OAG71_01845 [bacterium]|nr:hypothetical protein [bacterium]